MFQRVCRIVIPGFVLVAALCVYRLAVGSLPQPVLTLERDTPWLIESQHDEPLVATDAELQQVLTRVQPPAGVAQTNLYVHALRLWGPDATFADPARPSGAQLRDYFLNDKVFRARAAALAPPIFERTPDGYYRARFYDDGPKFRVTSSYHTDDLLATLAETGTPLDTPVILREGRTTVRELVESSLKDYNLARHEFEWTIITFARYGLPLKRWKNKWGETITVDDLVNELVAPPCGVGPCNGLHRLEALVVLYRADEKAKVLSHETRLKMLTHMKRVSHVLTESQTSDGYWTRRWPQGVEGQTDEKATVYDKLLVTGHQLEWLALAPAEVQPPRENIVRAARWTLKTVLEISDKELLEHYGPFSHAARALCLWRGKEAGEVWQDVGGDRTAAVGSPKAEVATEE